MEVLQNTCLSGGGLFYPALKRRNLDLLSGNNYSHFLGICQQSNGSSVSVSLQPWIPQRKELSEDLLMHRSSFSPTSASQRTRLLTITIFKVWIPGGAERQMKTRFKLQSKTPPEKRLFLYQQLWKTLEKAFELKYLILNT